jgi:membrane associated rhomboid family serine protease
MFYPAFALSMPWMFITSIFLHGEINHLLVNMIVLFFFGLSLENTLGSKRFIFIYFTSGIVGNLGYMITALNPYTAALGASGAIYGVMATLAALRPRALVFVMGLFPLPLIAVVVGYALLDFAGLFTPSDIAHGAHLGGLVSGAIYGLYIRQMVKRMQKKEYRF